MIQDNFDTGKSSVSTKQGFRQMKNQLLEMFREQSATIRVKSRPIQNPGHSYIIYIHDLSVM